MIFHLSSPLAALQFLSFAMLGWLAAAALPWLIHRWQRQRHQTTSWAAMELLLSAMQQRARRVQVQQWLLLAVRTAILALIALAVSEPAIRQWTSPGQTRVHRIVVVDQSNSMACVQGGTTRWQQAQAHARRRIESSAGDALTVIGWSEQAENLLGRPTFDKSIALAACEELQLTETRADLPTVLRAILSAMDRAEKEFPDLVQHEVVFCTDLGRQTWVVEDERELLATVGERANVVVVNVAEGSCDNRAVTDLQIEPAITLPQRESTITVTVSSFGELPTKSASVELLIDGQRVSQESLVLQKNGEATLRFTHCFLNAGTQTVSAVLLDNQDCLVNDDMRWMIVDVRPQLRIACFAGQPGTADDLARALTPLVGITTLSGGIQAEVFSVSRLSELDLSDYAAVLLGSVTELSLREAMALTEYARQGGGVAVFANEVADAASLDSLSALLPVEISEIQPVGEYRFDPQNYRHPIVAPFRGQTQSGLLGVAITQYCRLLLRKERESAEVVLEFDTGDPALVVDRFGLGRIAVSALPGSLVAHTDAGAPWSSFALSPSFLPVVRELVVYLVGDSWLQQRNLLVGQSAIFTWNEGTKAATVRLPSGTRETLPLAVVEDAGQRMFVETATCGVYRFAAGKKECARFAINLDGRESDLTPLDLDLLPVEFTENLVAGDGKLSHTGGDFSFTRMLLASVLVLLLFEIGLAWLLGRGWK